MNIGWPEGIILGLIAFNLILGACVDGEPKTGTHRFGVKLIDAAILMGLLYWGGFFA
jgi:hypothetical protein